MRTLLLSSLFFAVISPGAERAFEITFRVIDEVGNPVGDAETGITWENGSARQPSERTKSAEGKTAQDGRITLRGKTFGSGVSYGANKQGHYTAWGLRYHFATASLLRWQPWNPQIEVVLKRKRNPVPMFAKRIQEGLPELEKHVSYDLEGGDWLPPHGNGKHADIVFRGSLRKIDSKNGDYELVIAFPNPGDGIQRFKPEADNVSLRSPYEAPADGYSAELTLRQIRRPGVRDVTDFDSKGGYFIRLRTELDADGKIIRALYGKIYGDFFDMVYYLNPDGTRNIEFDPKQNLFKPRNYRDRDNYAVGP